MSQRELAGKLEDSIWSVFKIHASVSFRRDEIFIRGVTDKLDELKVYLFVHGYLYAIRTQNRKLKIHDPINEIAS